MNADTQTILQSWSNPVGVDLALCVTAVIYARGWFRLRSAFPDLISLWRLAAFLGGIVSVWIAIGSPLNAFDDALLTVHMLQHLLLMSIAPPLILLGAPQLPLLHGLPQFFARERRESDSPLESGEMAGTSPHESGILLARCGVCADRMAHPGGSSNSRCAGTGCMNSSTPAF